MKLKYLTYNDWVWRNIKIAKYFYNVEKLGKKNIDQVRYVSEKSMNHSVDTLS